MMVHKEDQSFQEPLKKKQTNRMFMHNKTVIAIPVGLHCETRSSYFRFKKLQSINNTLLFFNLTVNLYLSRSIDRADKAVNFFRVSL